MISYSTYWYLHIFGIALVILSLGGVALHAMSGGTKESSGGRRLAAISHGLGLLLILVAGFGMLARLGIVEGGIPGWVFLKLGVWAVIGALYMIPYRRPELAKLIWVATPFLVLAAGWLAHSRAL